MLSESVRYEQFYLWRKRLPGIGSLYASFERFQSFPEYRLQG